jgi:hypothetical protein
MVDKVLSGWGESNNKTNVLVFECANMDEARIVEDNANARTDMENVNVNTIEPQFDELWYHVQTKTKEDYPSWYVDGYFVRQVG